jgi:hypothetical protein
MSIATMELEMSPSPSPAPDFGAPSRLVDFREERKNHSRKCGLIQPMQEAIVNKVSADNARDGLDY